MVPHPKTINFKPLKLRRHLRHCKKGLFTAHFWGVDDVFLASLWRQTVENQNFGVVKKAVVMFKDV